MAFTHKLPKLTIIAICGVVLAVILYSLFAPAHATDAITTHNLGGEVYPSYPTIDYGTGVQAQIIKRGEYLAKAGDCIACHTDTINKGPIFAGGLGFKTPFGTFYSPNITPDKETGIGKWSDEDFIRAMHDGINPDGQYYYPVFPYTYFTKISHDDLLAIRAYLAVLPAVHQENKKNDVPWPFSWRFLQLGWRILFFHPKDFKFDPEHTTAWNRGAYLVQGLGHCGMCHTPMNFLGAPKQSYFLTGNFVQGYFAPDITSYGLKGIEPDEVEDVFTENEMLKGAGQVQGPMAEVNHDSLKYLDTADLQGIAIYLKTVSSKEPKIPTGNASAGAGKKVYNTYCAACHTSGAAGAPKMGDQTAWAPRIKEGMDVLMQHATNGFNSMPPKGTCMSCSDSELRAAVQYIIDQTQGGGSSSSSSAAPTTPPPPKPTLADGQKIYDTTCSVCHAQGLLGAPKLGDQAAWQPRIKQGMVELFAHTINGYNRMPPMGTCISCSNAEIEAAVKYMVQESKTGGDYSLW